MSGLLRILSLNVVVVVGVLLVQSMEQRHELENLILLHLRSAVGQGASEHKRPNSMCLEVLAHLTKALSQLSLPTTCATKVILHMKPLLD